jgi:hypothetical protein
MSFFVNPDSIVRKIWGKGDTILFIFAGASAEFALNKAVDWLYFTGKLPADPLGRLFTTVSYARQIVFSENEDAIRAIDKISSIHRAVEAQRQSQIPDWAYRDVLFMLIDYSIRAFEVLERRLTQMEKTEVFDVFYRVGSQMQLKGLPVGYTGWEVMRQEHLKDNLAYTPLTRDLYKQYRNHLGPVRYLVLKQAQVLVVPERVNQLLLLGRIQWLTPIIFIYKLSRLIKIDELIKNAILPKEYINEVKNLDVTQDHAASKE